MVTPGRNKIVNSPYEVNVIELILKDESSLRISQKLTEWGYPVDSGTVNTYRRWFVQKRKAEIEAKRKIKITEGWGPLLPGKETTVEYLQGLVELRERRVMALQEQMREIEADGGISLRLDDQIGEHLKEIQGLKESIAKLTGGVDEAKRRQWIIGQVSTMAVKNFLPLISEAQRDEVLKMFRGDILKFSEEM